MKYKAHKCCRLIPAMSASQKQELENSIRAHGVLVPILVWKGFIIDGRARYEIAKKLGKECPIHKYKGPEADLALIALELNIAFRHLPSIQVAAITVEAMAIRSQTGKRIKKRPGATENQSGNTMTPVDKRYDEIADRNGTNRRYLRFAKNLREQNPTAFRQLLNGKRKFQSLLADFGERLADKGTKKSPAV